MPLCLNDPVMQSMRWRLLSTLFTQNADFIFSMTRYENNALISSLINCDCQGEKIREPFHCGLGYVAQWLDGLHVLVEKKVEEALTVSDKELQHTRGIPLVDNQDIMECTCLSQQLCSACFGGSSFGQPLEE